MELFDKKFVHFMWDDELEGKECFVADDISTLKSDVSHKACSKRFGNVKKGLLEYPFQIKSWNWRFAYYDPNYEVKRAFNEGKKVQVKRIDCFADWIDCDEPIWSKECCYRVKSEEKTYRPYESPAEMIVDFIDRFKVNCPPYCEPLIWLKGKATDKRSLVIGFSPKDNKICVDGGRCDLLSLFTLYTYLDGSPVGMEAEND
jgi:hypothetical protein